MLEQLGKNAKAAATILAKADILQKNEALLAVAKALTDHQEEILQANERDIQNGKEAGMKESLLDRLALTPERIEGMAVGIRQVAELSDPV